jgi:hypothetical protein
MKNGIELQDNWITSFQFTLECGLLCGDGFSFLVQHDSPFALSKCALSDSWCHGYRDISPSFAVIFNAAYQSSISFAINGSNPANDFNIPTTIEFADGRHHNASIIFDRFQKKVDVYLDGLIQASFLFTSDVEWKTQHLSYLGFGGYSGIIHTSAVRISAWEFGTPTAFAKHAFILEEGKHVGFIGYPFNITITGHDSCKMRTFSFFSLSKAIFKHASNDLIVGASLMEYIGSGMYSVSASLPLQGRYDVFISMESENLTAVGTILIS